MHAVRHQDFVNTDQGNVHASRVADRVEIRVVDRPELVKRLVVGAAACRLGPIGKGVQLRYVTLLEEGRRRAAAGSVTPLFTKSPLAERAIGWLMWLAAPLEGPIDVPDLTTVMRAEDAFDAEGDLHWIMSPTLVIAGEDDRVYPLHLAKLTAERSLTLVCWCTRPPDTRRFSETRVWPLTSAPSLRHETSAAKPIIVVVTACPTGIAHTYMAADSLVNASKEAGYERPHRDPGNGSSAAAPGVRDCQRRRPEQAASVPLEGTFASTAAQPRYGVDLQAPDRSSCVLPDS